MNNEKNFLVEAVEVSKQAFYYVMLFSMVINLLMLALPLFTLQVLDRVVTSRSMETLAMLTLVITGAFVLFGVFSAIRTITLVRIGEWFDKKLSTQILTNSLTMSAIMPGVSGSQNLRDLNTLKSFLTGAGLIALFDAPWSIIYIVVLFLIHPIPGIVSLGGGIILFMCAVLNERAVKTALNEANEENVKSMNHVETSARNSEVIEAMGMMDQIVAAWAAGNEKVVSSQSLASMRSAVITSIAKSVRMLLQIIIISVGALLMMNNEITVGAIIACSILAGRSLAPFEQAIGTWTQVTGARKSYERLKNAIDHAPEPRQSMALPVPEGHVAFEKVLYALPGTNKGILKGFSFELPAGELLGVIGPSAAGKSTMAKLLVGVYKPTAGYVRLDGADVYSWNRNDFGQHVGYLPQDVELFAGTVRDNIARMQPDVSDENIIAAAKISGAHDMILRLPNGYETEIGVAGANLSAGQRQRIGLARAFYGEPKLLVLDEPNSNLDEVGESALIMALKNAKALKITTVVIAHRPSVLNFVDKILVVKDGMVADFGLAKEIMAKYSRANVDANKPVGQIQQQQQQGSGPNNPPPQVTQQGGNT